MATPVLWASDQIAQLQAIIEGWKAAQLTDYVFTAGITMIVVDYLQTLPDEVQLMWPSTGFNLPKFLFFALRYGIFAQRILLFYYMRLKWALATHCLWTLFSVTMFSCVILLASEAVLFVRLYAFSGRKRGMRMYLIFQFLVLAGAKFAMLAIFGKDILFMDGLPIPFCLPLQMSAELLGGGYIITFGNLFSVMLIMVYLARSQHEGLNSTLFAVFYRDGMLYFACLSLFALLNGILGFIAPGAYKFLFNQMEIDLHAMLSARMLLHLRAQGKGGPIILGDAPTGLSDIGTTDHQLQFARNPTSGNSMQVTSTVGTYTS